MRRRRNLFIIPLSVMLLVALAAQLHRNREPVYQGCPLSYWLDLYTAATYKWPHPEGEQAWARREEAAQAVRAIGPAAVPHLLKWIGREPRNPTTQLIDFLASHRPAWLPNWPATPPATDAAWLRAMTATEGFQLLGPTAGPAAPALLAAATRARSPAAAQNIVQALAALGAETVPALTSLLTNDTASDTEAFDTARVEVISQLMKLGTNAAPAIPSLVHCLAAEDEALAMIAVSALRNLNLRPDLTLPGLTNALQDPRPGIRIMAAEALGARAEAARLAVPALAALLHDPHTGVRKAAARALQEIAPAAPTHAATP